MHLADHASNTFRMPIWELNRIIPNVQPVDTVIDISYLLEVVVKLGTVIAKAASLSDKLQSVRLGLSNYTGTGIRWKAGDDRD